MSQDLLTYTDDELKKLLLKMSGGMAQPATVKPAPVATAPKQAPAPAITSGQPDLLKSILQKKLQGQATTTPSGTLPPLTPAEPVAKERPLQDTIGTYRTPGRGIFGGAGAYEPAAAEVMSLGPTRKTVADMVNEGGSAGIPGVDTARVPGKIIEDIAGGIKPVGQMLKNPLGALEAAGQLGAGIPIFFANTGLQAVKGIYNTITKGHPDMVDAKAWAGKITDPASEFFAPKTEGGKAWGLGTMLPFEVVFGGADQLWKEGGKALFPNDPEAQAQFRESGNFALGAAVILAGGAKHAKAGYGIEGKVTKMAPQVGYRASAKMQRWYADRVKAGKVPTIEEQRTFLRKNAVPEDTIGSIDRMIAKVEEPLVDSSRKMIQNMEEVGGGPEGALGPTRASAPGTVIKTSDGTTITVAPPRQPVAAGTLAARQRQTPGQISTPEGVLGQRPVALTTKKAAGATKTPAVEAAIPDIIEKRGAGEWTPEARALVDKARNPQEVLTRAELDQLAGLAEESERLRTVAYQDALTGAPNRAALVRDFGENIEVGPDQSIAVIDLGGLKAINDGPGGHAAGDAALKRVAISAQKRKLTIYRTGGDEFVIVGKTKGLKNSLNGFKRAAKDRAGINIHFGVAKELSKADALMYEMKEAAPPSERRTSLTAPEGAPTGTFSREETYAILKSVEEQGGLDSLAQSFGVDPTGKTPRQIMAEVGPQLMKIEKRKGAIQDVARRTREDVSGEPIGMDDVPQFPWDEPKTAKKAKTRPTTQAPPAKVAPAKPQAPPAEGKPLGREALKAIAEDQARKFDEFRPEPKDPAAKARWLEDKKNFVTRATVAKARKASGGNVGFFGTGAIQDMYERFKSGTKDADKVAWLMEQWNQKIDTIKKGGEEGWAAYYVADAIEQMGPLYRAISEAYHKMTGGKGFYESVMKYKTEEGQKNADRIRELQAKLEDLDAQHDRATGMTTEETLTRKKEVPYQEGKTYQEAGMPVELGRFKAYVDETSKVAASPVTPEGAKAEVARIMGEKDAVLQEISNLEKQAFEHELTLEPVVTEAKRPEPYESVEAPVAKDLSWKPTKAEQKILDANYTREDWLARSAAETRKRESKISPEREIATPARIEHQEVYAAMTLLEENIRKARARKRTVSPKEMVGVPQSHPLYKPLHDALAAGDLAKADSIIKNAKNRLMDYAVEEGGPYRESPAIPEERPGLTEGEPVIQVPPGQRGVLRDKENRPVKRFDAGNEERGHVQFRRQDVETPLKDQQQWRKSMKDVTKENAPGIPGHFSNTDQFPRIFPEAPKGSYPKVIDRANRINDMAIEALDKLMEEGIRSRLTKEKVFLESETGGLTKADRALSPYGATIEDVLRSKKADAWVKTFKFLKKIDKLGQLDQINNVVKEHMDARHESAAARAEAIAADIRNLPISKIIFKYSERAAKNALGETVKTMKGAPLEDWQLNQAIFDAFEASKGDDFMARFASELEGYGKMEFEPQGSTQRQLNQLALRLFAEQFWADERISDYTRGNVVKKRGVELLLREGVSAPVAQHVLIKEFGASNVPTKAENVGAWGEGYKNYLKEHMEDWAPEALRKYRRLAEGAEGVEGVLEKQRLTGGPVENSAKILDHYFGPIIRELDRRAGRTPVAEKVRRAIDERRAEKLTEETRLRKEADAQNKKIEESPEDYNIIEVPEEGEKPHFPWDEEPGGGGAGFLGTPWMYNKLTKQISDAVKKWVAGLKETRAERAQRMDREARTHRFSDPASQAAWEAGHRASRVDTAGQALNKRIREARDSLTRVYKHLPNKPEFAFAIDKLKWMEKEYARSTNEANQIVNGYVLKAIDDIASPHTKRRLEDTFAKKVFMDDMQEMYDGGAVEFPQRLTRASVPIEAKRIQDYIDALPIDEKNTVMAAVDASRAKMKEITDQIVVEGDVAGYNLRDIFNRKNYYRHELLAYYDKQVRGGKKMKPSTYSWGQKRRAEGYAGDIVTDVRLVNTEILTRLVYERDRLKIHNALDKNYNIYDRIEAEAVSKGMSMKEAYDKLVPDTHEVYFFDQNHLIFNAMTLSERLAKKILDGKFEEITKSDVSTVRERMAIGPKRKPWIIPKELAATLDDFAKPRPEPSWYAQVPVEVTSMWKGWKLLGPKRILKFQFRNLTGDAEMHAIGNPSTFTKVKPAIKMLDDYYRKGIASPEMLEWIDKGGMDTTFHWAEVGDFQRLWKFSESMADKPMAATIGPEMLKKGWNTYADWAKKSSDLREGTLRLASYLDYRDQIVKNNMNGRGEVPNNYGASVRGMIDALPDVQTKAFWLSNELSGAYDMVSPMGRAARQGLVPFWSWKELTTKRYYRMMKNAYVDGKTARQIGRQFAPAAPYAALQAGKFILKANAAMAILQAINHIAPAIVGDPDAEEKLPVDVQSKPHITFGKGHYFSQVGAASDLLDFFGMDIPTDMAVQFVRDIDAGRTPDLEDIVKKWLKEPPMVNQIFQSITPFLKVPADLLYGRKTYPDIYKPRGIRDPLEYVADQLDLGSEYRIAVGRPGKDTVGQLAAKLFDYQHEENETAYFDWLGVANDFRKSRGNNTVGYSITPRSNYLYYFKRANAEGDKETALRYFKKYVTATYLQGGLKGKDYKDITSGIMQGILQSYKNMHPLYQLSPVEIAELSKQLRPEQRRMLLRATKYWAEVIVGKEHAPGVTADIEKEQSELEIQ